jgi:hypothetical protein
MNIKRLLSFITVVIFSFGLSSCIVFKPKQLTQNDEEIADTRFQEIIEAIGRRDKEGLKKMFSINALKEAESIDDDIEYLMQFYKGSIQSKDGTVVTSDSKNDGEKTKKLECYYTVVTDKDTYIVFFINQVVDTKNPDNLGLYMLQIIKQSDEEEEFDWGGEKTGCAGIYRPKDTESK